jgi:Uma2 family endonuclease
MGEPAWKMPPGENEEPDDDSPGFPLLERVVEHRDGRLEIRHTPLTVRSFLNPRYGDKWLQGFAHQKLTAELWQIVTDHFASQPDVVVTSDVQYLFGPGLSKPVPDVGVLRDVRDRKLIQESVDVQKAGRPCLLIEVVSPKNPRIRDADEKRKVRLYRRAGIPEYVLVRPPRDKDSGEPIRLWGYRLGLGGRYRLIEPDGQGRLLSETTGLAFAVSPGGDQVDVFDAATGKRLLRHDEIMEAQRAAERARETAEKRAAHAMASRRAAEEKAARATEAQKAAEEELARLRAELERYKKSSDR